MKGWHKMYKVHPLSTQVIWNFYGAVILTALVEYGRNIVVAFKKRAYVSKYQYMFLSRL